MKVKDSSDTDPSIEILIPLETVIILFIKYSNISPNLINMHLEI